MSNAPDNAQYILGAGNPSLSSSLVLATDQGLGLVSDGTNMIITPEDLLGAFQELTGNGIPFKIGPMDMAIRQLMSDQTITIDNSDGVLGAPNIKQVPSSTLQLVRVLENGVPIGVTSNLNLIAGTGAGVTVVQDGQTMNITYTATSDASINAPYWVSSNFPTLPNQVNIGNLSSGVLKITTSGGIAVPSIATQITEVGDGLFIGTNTMAPGGKNVVIGTGAGQNAGASNHVLIGYNAAQNISVWNGTTVIGSTALMAATNGILSTVVGCNAFNHPSVVSNTVGIGYNVGISQDKYNSCILIGNLADCSANDLTNAIAIGVGSIVGASNTMVLGAPGTKVVIGDSTAQNGGYALNLDETGSSASLWMGRSASQTTPTSTGGVFSIDANDAPRYTAGPAGFSGSIVVASTSNGTAGQVLKSNGPGVAPSWQTDTTGTVVNSGQASLTAGSSGTISLTGVTPSSRIVATYYGTVNNPGTLSITLGTNNFTINSTNPADTSTVSWHAIIASSEEDLERFSLFLKPKTKVVSQVKSTSVKKENKFFSFIKNIFKG